MREGARRTPGGGTFQAEGTAEQSPKVEGCLGAAEQEAPCAGEGARGTVTGEGGGAGPWGPVRVYRGRCSKVPEPSGLGRRNVPCSGGFELQIKVSVGPAPSAGSGEGRSRPLARLLLIPQRLAA